MEPIDLTCAKCNATWKLIKAEGAIACPYCKAIVDSPTPTISSPATVPAPVPTEATAALEKPPESAASEAARPVPDSDSIAPTEANSIPMLARLGPFPTMDDADDPGVRADYDDRHDAQRRSGMHPLLRVFIILLILFILLPVALVILIFVVCAVMLAAR